MHVHVGLHVQLCILEAFTRSGLNLNSLLPKINKLGVFVANQVAIASEQPEQSTMLNRFNRWRSIRRICCKGTARVV